MRAKALRLASVNRHNPTMTKENFLLLMSSTFRRLGLTLCANRDTLASSCQLSTVASRFASRKTASNIFAVSLPVAVFWFEG
jgi:hypothetical protein